jgi:hypothetical protein
VLQAQAHEHGVARVARLHLPPMTQAWPRASPSDGRACTLEMRHCPIQRGCAQRLPLPPPISATQRRAVAFLAARCTSCLICHGREHMHPRSLVVLKQLAHLCHARLRLFIPHLRGLLQASMPPSSAVECGGAALCRE